MMFMPIKPALPSATATASGWSMVQWRRSTIGLILDSYIAYEFLNPRRNQPLDAAVFDVPKR